MTAQAISIKPPQDLIVPVGYHRVFLAGSIEMGRAEEWQAHVESQLSDLSIAFFNPRRTDWNANAQQHVDDSYFRRQVEWELNALEKADTVAMYLQPGTESRISLVEFGLYARSGKLIVCCPHGFVRKGNIDITCKYYDVPTVSNIGELVVAIREKALASQESSNVRCFRLMSRSVSRFFQHLGFIGSSS